MSNNEYAGRDSWGLTCESLMGKTACHDAHYHLGKALGDVEKGLGCSKSVA
jgi:hypothetical protein